MWPSRLTHARLVAALALVSALALGATGAALASGHASAPRAPVPGGPGHVSLNGLSFRTFSANTSYAYVLACLYYSGGSSFDYFAAPIQVPNGATLNQLVVYFKNADAGHDLQVLLQRIPLGESTGDTLATVVSSGSVAGPRIVSTAVITSPLVDLSANSYLLQASLPASSGVQLCAVRVDYDYPAALPVVRK